MPRRYRETFTTIKTEGNLPPVDLLQRITEDAHYRPPLSKSIGDDRFELRQVGKLNTRVLYFFMKSRRIILVHGIRKKTRALSARDRVIALERKYDEQFKVIFDAIKALMKSPEQPKKRIGFVVKEPKARYGKRGAKKQ